MVAETERELQRLAPDRRCRDIEGLADLLRTTGPATAEEVAARCTVPDAAAGGWPSWPTRAAPWRSGSAASPGGRRSRMPGGCRTPWACRCRPGCRRRSPSRCPTRWATWLRGTHARTGRSPRMPPRRVTRWAWRSSRAPCAWPAAAGRVVEGEFLPGGRGTEWCDAEVLRLLRRRCLARLRKEAEPARPPVALARLLPAWQGVRPIEAFTGAFPGRGGYPARLRVAAGMTGPGAVLDVIDQLAGAPVPASALETLVLPGAGAQLLPRHAGRATTAGEVAGPGRAGCRAATGGWCSRPRSPRRCCSRNRRRSP